MRFLTTSLIAALAACSLSSCSFVFGLFEPKPREYNINVGYDPSTVESFRVFPSVEVDVVEANDALTKQLEQVDIDDYFDPDNTLRTAMRKRTFCFSEEDNADKKLLKDNPVWKTWLKKRGATHVVLLVNLPRDGAKGPDMRKLVLPLTSDRWEGDDIDVSIIPAGFLLQTPMVPEED